MALWIAAVAFCLCALCYAFMRYVTALADAARDRRRYRIIASAVCAAEQLYGPGKGEAKRRFVRERTQGRVRPDLSRDELEEAVWLEVGRGKAA